MVRILIIFFLTFIHSAFALCLQDSIINKHENFLTAATGVGGSSFGTTYNFNVSFQKHKNSLSIGYINSIEVNPSTDFFGWDKIYPPIKMWEVNLLVNRSVIDKKKFKTIIGCGASFGKGARRGEYLYERPLGSLASNTYYQAINFTVIGADLHIQEVWKYSKSVSIEITWFTNFNPQKNYYGALLGIVYSYPFSNK